MNEKKDQIGIDDILERLAYRVDAVSAEENVCVSLNGAWGSGKTFILEKFESKLRGDNNKDKYLVVKYDAWKNNFYSDPLIAILFCIFDELEGQVRHGETKRAHRNQKKQAEKSQTGEEKDCQNDNVQKNKVKKLIKKVIKEISNNTVDIASLLCDKIGKLNGWASIVAVTAEIIKSIIKQATYKTLDHEKFDDFKSYQSLLNEAKGTLNALTSQKNKYRKKLVILVDEIDRCLPSEQMLILERLHHLFDIKNCAVIVALNEAAVVNGYNKQFIENGTEQFSDGNMYLRKFFDYEVKVPYSGNIYLCNVLRDILAEQNEKNSEKDKLSNIDINFIVDCVEQIYNTEINQDRIGHNIQDYSVRTLEKYKIELERLFAIDCDKKNFIWCWFAIVGLFARRNSPKYQAYSKEKLRYDGIVQLNKLFKDAFEKNGLVGYTTDYYQSVSNGILIPESYEVYKNTDVNALQYVINEFLFELAKSKALTNNNDLLQLSSVEIQDIRQSLDINYEQLEKLVDEIER